MRIPDRREWWEERKHEYEEAIEQWRVTIINMAIHSRSRSGTGSIVVLAVSIAAMHALKLLFQRS